MFLTYLAVIKTCKAKEKIEDKKFFNILRLFDILSDFPFTTSQTMGGYYLSTWYIQVALRVAQRLKAQEMSGKCLNLTER